MGKAQWGDDGGEDTTQEGADHEARAPPWQAGSSALRRRGCRRKDHTLQTLKSIAVGVLFLASTAGASTVERTYFGTQATCSCKGKGDCTCAKGQCKCKSCGNGSKTKVFEALKGSNETTVLPDTARLDARGGVFI